MVPNSGSRLPKTQISLSDGELAELIGFALKRDLGASRRATKTVMAWTGVSDHTARAWLNGRASPSAVHLVMLAANCRPVMLVVLRLTGHDDIGLEIDLEAIERGLEELLASARSLRAAGR